MPTNPSFTIAIVDDNALIRQAIQFRLTKLGYDVIMEAENGKEFLDNLSYSSMPDVCLLDINMPVMNGFETAVELKKKWPDIKICFFSMHNDQAYINRSMELGADGYVSKDAPITELTGTLLKIMNRVQVA